MNRTAIFPVKLLILIIALSSCGNKGLIENKETLSYIESRLKEVSIVADARSDALFKVFDDSNLSRDERDGLKFYYSSMPLSDLADYNGEFYLENVRASLKARRDFVWAQNIPEEIYLHYVLPIRVNNENLDSFRTSYYDEIHSRIDGYTDMESAALEINHWCHEKVSYQGADIRTSGPMATILSARGRCGEESTFTVAALRTAGIPARQVYVPRWAHSDDNHAWVEVWIDGVWKYMGACEPEAVLNHGWFTGPASRAMLVNTKSFGYYLGQENVVANSKYYSEINNLNLYADTKAIVVKVLDNELNPVENASVEYKLYNYAEFYTLARTETDSDGLTSFTTGKGNLLIWSYKDSEYGFELISVEETDTVAIIISDQIPEESSYRYNLSAPEQTRVNPTVSEELQQENLLRLAEEDRIRETYISSWPDKDRIISFARANGYPEELAISIISRSMGNYTQIMNFLEEADFASKDDAIGLLSIIKDKDLRDTPAYVLHDHLSNSRKYLNDTIDKDIFLSYVLNPRIANEILVPWRSFLQELSDEEKIESFKANPERIAAWLRDRVLIDDERNYYEVPVSPVGSIELGVSDRWSGNILFVALCRSYGIPARLENGTNFPQYYFGSSWINVSLSDQSEHNEGLSELTIFYNGHSITPEYYSHFTLGKFDDGVYETLDFEYGRKLDEFIWPLKLTPGKYILVSGNRINSTEILAEINFFELFEGRQLKVELNLREREIVNPVLNSISPENRVYVGDAYKSVYDRYSTGTVIAWIDHEREPSKHFLEELRQESNIFEKWGGSIFLLSDSSRITDSFDLDRQTGFPGNTIIGLDPGNGLLNDVFPDIDPRNILYPFVVFVDSENEIVFKSEGYQLGIGDQLQRHIDAQKK